MNSELLEKIKKCLELARRGGTEAEAEAAMAKVQMLLAKHNLSLEQVEESSKQKPEDVGESGEDTTIWNKWQGAVWQGVSQLYFCDHFTRTYRMANGKLGKRNIIIGKPSNIAVAMLIIADVNHLGDRLARLAGSGRVFQNSFKKGFGHRIWSRCMSEIQKARQGEVKDETGRALIIAPLYDKSKKEVSTYLRSKGIRLSMRSSRTSIRDMDGYNAGKKAADGVSLRSNGVTGNAGRLAIGN